MLLVVALKRAGWLVVLSKLLQKMNVKLTMRIFTEAEEGCLHF